MISGVEREEGDGVGMGVKMGRVWDEGVEI